MAFLYANGLLLLTVTFIPFPTAVLAEYIDTPQANIAVMFHSAAWLVVNAGFNVWWLSMFRPVRLLPAVSHAAVKRVTIQIVSGLRVYACTAVISYWFPTSALLLILASQVLWVVVSIEDEKPDALM